MTLLFEAVMLLVDLLLEAILLLDLLLEAVWLLDMAMLKGTLLKALFKER